MLKSSLWYWPIHCSTDPYLLGGVDLHIFIGGQQGSGSLPSMGAFTGSSANSDLYPLRVAGHTGYVPIILNGNWVIVGCGLVGHGGTFSVWSEIIIIARLPTQRPPALAPSPKHPFLVFFFFWCVCVVVGFF